MPKNDMEFDLEDILAEFHAMESEHKAAPAPRPRPAEPAPQRREEPVKKPAAQPEKKAEPAPAKKPEAPQKAPAKKPEPVKAGTPEQKPAAEPLSREPEEEAPRARKLSGGMKAAASVVYALLLVWGLFQVHPGAKLVEEKPVVTLPPMVTETPAEMPELTEPGTETTPDASPVPTEEPKPRYTIPEGSVLVPKANPENFGSLPVANASELSAVIQQARDSGLLSEDEKMVFDPSLDFNTGSYYQDIKYYYDETVLAIAWKQIVDGNTVTCMEVKVADASQFRRKITGDTYGSPVDYLSNLNKSTNAIVSMNADFYQFRDYGVMVYDGILYKCTDKRYLVHNGIDYKWYNCLDNCFITRDGDMLFTYFGEEYSWDEMQQFINDNNISFSLSFGPILVDNYEVQTHYADWYPVGEVDQGYSRAGFGQLDERHYLYMSLNHSDEKSARWTMLEFGQFFQTRGVEKAYAFDGGQTSEIIFNGEIYNHIDKSSERWVSDMVYFGTALPEEVWNLG